MRVSRQERHPLRLLPPAIRRQLQLFIRTHRHQQQYVRGAHIRQRQVRERERKRKKEKARASGAWGGGDDPSACSRQPYPSDGAPPADVSTHPSLTLPPFPSTPTPTPSHPLSLSLFFARTHARPSPLPLPPSLSRFPLFPLSPCPFFSLPQVDRGSDQRRQASFQAGESTVHGHRTSLRALPHALPPRPPPLLLPLPLPLPLLLSLPWGEGLHGAQGGRTRRHLRRGQTPRHVRQSERESTRTPPLSSPSFSFISFADTRASLRAVPFSSSPSLPLLPFLSFPSSPFLSSPFLSFPCCLSSQVRRHRRTLHARGDHPGRRDVREWVQGEDGPARGPHVHRPGVFATMHPPTSQPACPPC